LNVKDTEMQLAHWQVVARKARKAHDNLDCAIDELEEIIDRQHFALAMASRLITSVGGHDVHALAVRSLELRTGNTYDPNGEQPSLADDAEAIIRAVELWDEDDEDDDEEADYEEDGETQ
jgi:hypothetical protein